MIVRASSANTSVLVAFSGGPELRTGIRRRSDKYAFISNFKPKEKAMKSKQYSYDDVLLILNSMPDSSQKPSQLRLLACALARLVWPLMDFRSQLAVEIAEEFARGEASWPKFILGLEAADIVVRERESISFERDLTDAEAAQEHAAWAAWGTTRTKSPWKPLTVALDAVANALRCQGKSELDTYREICGVLREASAIPVACA
jgi:hypothetical protein